MISTTPATTTTERALSRDQRVEEEARRWGERESRWGVQVHRKDREGKVKSPAPVANASQYAAENVANAPRAVRRHFLLLKERGIFNSKYDTKPDL